MKKFSNMSFPYYIGRKKVCNSRGSLEDGLVPGTPEELKKDIFYIFP